MFLFSHITISKQKTKNLIVKTQQKWKYHLFPSLLHYKVYISKQHPKYIFTFSSASSSSSIVAAAAKYSICSYTKLPEVKASYRQCYVVAFLQLSLFYLQYMLAMGVKLDLKTRLVVFFCFLLWGATSIWQWCHDVFYVSSIFYA